MTRRTLPTLYLLYWSLLLLFLVLWGNLSCEYPAGFDDGAFYSMAFAHNAGLNFYDGIVDVKPPLLIYLTSFGFRFSQSIFLIKWLSIVVFGVLILTVYLTLKFASGRSDIGCLGATLIATNWSLRHYGVVELSQSYWQAMLCLFSLMAIFFAVSIHQYINQVNGYQRLLAGVLLLLASFIWAIAFYTKQQSVVVLPAAVALILLYRLPNQGLRLKLCYVSVFALGALGSVLLLYHPILGNSPVAESYKYIFLANIDGISSVNYTGWWSKKGTVLIDILNASVRVPVIALIVLEAQVLIWIVMTYWRGGRGSASLAIEPQGQIAYGRQNPFVGAISLWALSTVMFYFLHNRAQTHYLLEIAVSLTFLMPLLVSRFRRYPPVSVVLANVVIMSAITLWHGVITDPIGSAARDKWKVDRQVAEAIARSSDVEDRVLLFTNPVLYCLSNRLPASRFPFFTVVWKSPSMMREYRRATFDGLTAETTKVVVVHDRILQEMPEWLRSMVIEELTKKYRPLSFQGTDIYFGTTTVYVRHKSIALFLSRLI
jgi:hypothetical protein